MANELSNFNLNGTIIEVVDSKARQGLTFKPSYIGMIDMSTTNNTLAKVQAIYGSDTSWIQHSGYVLRGATSGVTPNNGTKTGGNDSVSYTPSGSNSGGGVQNHTLTASEIPAHTHGSRTFTGTFYSRKYKGSATATGVTDLIMSGSGSVSTATETWSGSHAYLQASSLDGITDPERTKVTITNTHTHDSVGGNGAHGHGFTQPTFTGTNATINTLPNYKSVYIWERIG